MIMIMMMYLLSLILIPLIGIFLCCAQWIYDINSKRLKTTVIVFILCLIIFILICYSNQLQVVLYDNTTCIFLLYKEIQTLIDLKMLLLNFILAGLLATFIYFLFFYDIIMQQIKKLTKSSLILSGLTLLLVIVLILSPINEDIYLRLLYLITICIYIIAIRYLKRKIKSLILNVEHKKKTISFSIKFNFFFSIYNLKYLVVLGVVYTILLLTFFNCYSLVLLPSLSLPYLFLILLLSFVRRVVFCFYFSKKFFTKETGLEILEWFLILASFKLIFVHLITLFDTVMYSIEFYEMNGHKSTSTDKVIISEKVVYEMKEHKPTNTDKQNFIQVFRDKFNLNKLIKGNKINYPLKNLDNKFRCESNTQIFDDHFITSFGNYKIVNYYTLDGDKLKIWVSLRVPPHSIYCLPKVVDGEMLRFPSGNLHFVPYDTLRSKIFKQWWDSVNVND